MLGAVYQLDFAEFIACIKLRHSFGGEGKWESCYFGKSLRERSREDPDSWCPFIPDELNTPGPAHCRHTADIA